MTWTRYSHKVYVAWLSQPGRPTSRPDSTHSVFSPARGQVLSSVRPDSSDASTPRCTCLSHPCPAPGRSTSRHRQVHPARDRYTAAGSGSYARRADPQIVAAGPSGKAELLDVTSRQRRRRLSCEVSAAAHLHSGAVHVIPPVTRPALCGNVPPLPPEDAA